MFQQGSWIAPCGIFLAVFAISAQAAQWEPSLASTASLRTGRASLVSSDALVLDGDRKALITYWEARKNDNFDVYRCVDIVSVDFSPISQQCWSVLRPTGRGPIMLDDVRGSEAICAQSHELSRVNSAAFCNLSRSTSLRTPFFGLTVSPFEKGGAVFVGDDGRYVVVTDSASPSSVFFEVRMVARATNDKFRNVTSLQDIEARVPGVGQCEEERISGRRWLKCLTTSPPERAAHYLIEGDDVLEVSHSVELAAPDVQTIDMMLHSITIAERED